MNNRRTGFCGMIAAGVCAALFMSALSSTPQAAAALYVATNATPTPPFDMWSKAFTNLQDALNAAIDNDTIYMAGHTFAVTTQVAWTSRVGMTIRGGYAAADDGDLPGTNNPALWPTVICRSGPANHRVFYAGWLTNGTLEKVTVCNGKMIGASDQGAGLYAANVMNLQVSGCIFSNNVISDNTSDSADLRGAGIYVANGTGTITDCWIASNQVNAYRGWGGQVSRGGGVYIAGGAWRVNRCVIRNNSADCSANNSYGGGVYHVGGGGSIENCLIFSNRCTGSATKAHQGDGIYGTNAVVLNCTIVTNGVGNPGGGEGIRGGGGGLMVSNSIVWANGNDIAEDVLGCVALRYSCIEDGDNKGVDGCVDANPLFMDTGYYHLQSTVGVYTGGYFGGGAWTTAAADSPLIDAGDASSPAGDEPQPNGGRINMGAYGNTAAASLSHPLLVTNAPASRISPTGATLNGALLDVGSSNVSVWFYWGTTDGSNNATLWDTNAFVEVRSTAGPVSLAVSNLLSTTYYFTCFASNAAGATCWASPSTSFLATVSAPEVENRGADNECGPTVTLNGEIMSTGGDAPAVYVCWGPHDGGAASTADWDNVVSVGTEAGSFSKAIETLAGSNYWYTCFATNTAGWDWAAPALPFGARRIRYVSCDAAGSGTGFDWTNSYTSMQDALDDCVAGKTNVIYVKGGLYALPAALQITCSVVTVRGGYEGAGFPGDTDTSQWPTILTNAVGNKRLLTISGVRDIEVRDVILTGGTLQGDFGGVSMQSATNATLRNCIIRGNLANGMKGGGVGVVNSTDVLLSGCRIELNRASHATATSIHGGGVYATNSSGVISNCWFADNRAESTMGFVGSDGVFFNAYGGAICLLGGAWAVVDTVLAHNKAYAIAWRWSPVGSAYGAGLCAIGGTQLVRNCLVVQNYSQGSLQAQGHGVFHNGGMAISNSTIAGNFGEGARNTGVARPVTDSILWGNGDDVAGSMTLDHCCIEDGDSNGVSGNIALDPLFERGFYLVTGSPCIDNGSQDAGAAGLAGYTTRAAGTPDADAVDIGYHYIAGIGASADLYVIPGGAGSEDGSSWADALPTLRSAMSRAALGAYLHLGAGIYSNAAEAFPIPVGVGAVRILGTNSALAILNGTGSSNVLSLLENCFAHVEGVTICNASNSIASSRGVGIAVELCTGIVIADCVISNNAAAENATDGTTLSGAGFHAATSDGAMRDCLVADNRLNAYRGWGGQAARGAGCYTASGSWLFDRCVVRGNLANSSAGTGYGGGFYLLGGPHSLRNCLVYSNNASGATAQADGIGATNAVVENCTIVGNMGEGVRQYGGSLALLNCIVWTNGDDLAGFSTNAAGIPTNVMYSCIQNGDNDGTNGCIAGDPKFVGATNDDYHLVQGSPCVNAGFSAGWMTSGTDLDGNPRRQNGGVDMGCYETSYGGGTMIVIN